MSSRGKVLNLYKTMMRTSQDFGTYNYRMYALRRIRDSFKENKNLTDKNEINDALVYAYKNLDIIKRQTIVGKLYSTEKLVIEEQRQQQQVQKQHQQQ